MSVLLEDSGGNITFAAAADNAGAGGGGSSTVSRTGSKGSANNDGGGSTGGAATGHSQNAVLQRLFYVFEKDPKGAVHRAWGITLLFIVAFFVISVIESTYS